MGDKIELHVFGPDCSGTPACQQAFQVAVRRFHVFPQTEKLFELLSGFRENAQSASAATMMFVLFDPFSGSAVVTNPG